MPEIVVHEEVKLEKLTKKKKPEKIVLHPSLVVGGTELDNAHVCSDHFVKDNLPVVALFMQHWLTVDCSFTL